MKKLSLARTLVAVLIVPLLAPTFAVGALATGSAGGRITSARLPRHPGAAGPATRAADPKNQYTMVTGDHFMSISSADSYTCGVRTNGAIVCWGLIGVPPSGRFATVAAGVSQTCALRTDGTAHCWSRYADDALVDPRMRFRHISVGAYPCGLRSDGAVMCWWTALQTLHTRVHSGNFIKVAAGQGHDGCGIERSHRLACWGELRSQMPLGAFLDVSVGGYTTDEARPQFGCAIRLNRTVKCWGDNTYGQTDSPPGHFEQVRSGAGDACGVRQDGVLLCWGAGQIGPDGTFAQVSVGNGFVCAIDKIGAPTCAGDNEFAQTEVPGVGFSQVDRNCGIRLDYAFTCWGYDKSTIASLGSVSQFSQSSEGDYLASMCAVSTDHSLTCLASNPSTPTPPGSFLQVSLADDSACAVRTNHSVVCWGGEELPSPSGKFLLVSVGVAGGNLAADFACGIHPSGWVECWGSATGPDGKPDGQTTPPVARFTQLSAEGSLYGMCGLRKNTTIACWGMADAPPRGNGYTQISTGNDDLTHRIEACGINTHGMIACGDNGATRLVPGNFRFVSGGYWNLGTVSTNGSFLGPWANIPAAVP